MDLVKAHERVHQPDFHESGSASALRGGVSYARRHVLQLPRVRVIFQQNGRPHRVEWQWAESAGADCCPPDQRCARVESSVAVIVQDPSSRVTSVDLEGLSLIDSGGPSVQRVEPYRITDVLSLRNGFETTYSSVLAYRIWDGQASAPEARLTRVTAAFAPAESFHLYFLFRDAAGNPGRISVYADVDSYMEIEPLRKSDAPM